MKTFYQNRQETVRKKMFQCGLRKALVTDPVNILYLTGANIVPYERFMGLLLDAAEEKSYLVIPAFEKGNSQDENTVEVLYKDHEDALLVLVSFIQGCEKLGVEKKKVPFFIVERLKELLKQGYPAMVCDLSEVDSLLETMRLYKAIEEIEKMTTAAQYTGDILGAVKEKLLPGISEQEIKFELFQKIFLENALMGPASPIQVSSGVHASMAHGMKGNKKLEIGETVIIDFGVIYQHYRSDITRTFFVGKPKPDFEKIYHVVREAQQKAIEIVKPGIAIKEIDLAARMHIENAGYGEFFTTRIGHGLGMEIHESPSIHNQNEGIIEEGMVFTIEPGIYVPGLGGVRIEDDIFVGKEGAMELTQYPKELVDVVVG